MPCEQALKVFQSLGRMACFAVSILLVAYVITTALGLASLESPDDPIEDPYFTLMELLILVIMPLMMLSMVALHDHTSPALQLYSLSSLAFMAITAGITSCVHFVILTVSRPISQELENTQYFLSFEWPSVAYALDILAWDWFFALSMLIGAFVVAWGTRMEKALRILMLISGILSFIGLIALPLDNMQVRMIGIVGYAVFTIGVFALMGILLGTTAPPDDSTEEPCDGERADHKKGNLTEEPCDGERADHKKNDSKRNLATQSVPIRSSAETPG
jgi:hypothetical protein